MCQYCNIDAGYKRREAIFEIFECKKCGASFSSELEKRYERLCDAIDQAILKIDVGRPPLSRPTRRQRLAAWFKTAWHRLLIWLAVLALLAGCTGGRNPGQQYGPTWPHARCDVISLCWPVDGAPRR